MFERLLEKIALALDENSVPYMIIGGQAVLVYGEPRLTRDIDITVGMTLEGLDMILELAGRIGLEPLVDPESFTRRTMVLPCQDPETEIRVDFIFSFSDYEQQAMRRVHIVKMGAALVRFASVEDLLIHKVIAGRPRDLEDAKSVLTKNPVIDVAYVRRWLRKFSTTLKKPFTRQFNTLLKEID